MNAPNQSGWKPAMTPERLAAMLQDAQPCVVVTRRAVGGPGLQKAQPPS